MMKMIVSHTFRPFSKAFLLVFTLTGFVYGQQSIFPQPNKLVVKTDFYAWKSVLLYNSSPGTDTILEVVKPQFSRHAHVTFSPTIENEAPDIRFNQQAGLGAENYILEIDYAGITITYATKTGLLYALQSLDQWLTSRKSNGKVPQVEITDNPRFSYRGTHLDCSRHFFTVTELKGFLNQMLALKLNTFHWHLTDDQGWRIEIKQYPKLTEVGAWRDSTLIGHYSRTPREYDHVHYGGFYTQEDAKEIVAYAAARGITVIPEIELPGHARAALAAYPELGCTGEKLPVPGLWGVFDDVFCSKQETITFLQNVLEEVIAIFPSQTIHIGGDEVPKVRWDACPRCKLVREEHGLKDSHELQRYFIEQMETFLRSHGRKLIGWDEILEGGLADNALVMSWRGNEGGIEAAKQHHGVVMTPSAYCYFDHYQSGHPDEPLAIGGYLPLEKVYDFNPMPEGLSPEEQAFILGGQANIWTEYLPDIKAVQYNAFPRLVAMAQVLWTKKTSSYPEFAEGLTAYYLPRLEQDGIRYSTSFLDPVLVPVSTETGLKYELSSFPAIQTAVNGTEATVIELNRTPALKKQQIAVSANYKSASLRTSNYQFVTHSLIGIPVQFITPPHPKYSHHGNLGLTDGVRGSLPWRGDQWLGFLNDTVQFVVDRGTKSRFSTVELGCLNDSGSWIYLSKHILIETSDDGLTFQLLTEEAITSEQIKIRKKGTGRFVRITLLNDALIPAGKPGAETTPWTFVDEVMIY